MVLAVVIAQLWIAQLFVADLVPCALRHRNVGVGEDVAPVAPGVKIGQLVGADQPNKACVGRGFSQCAHGINGVGGLIALDFQRIDGNRIRTRMICLSMG